MNFEVPELGEGVQEGELIAWKVKVGDTVSMDQPLLEVMTDKATVEIPSPVAGTIKEIKAAEGDRLKIGQVILVIEEGAKASAAA
ncbi:MAG: biotin/lipoyl-containing protein, partial [bacterium]